MSSGATEHELEQRKHTPSECHHSFLLHSHIVFTMPSKHRLLVDSQCVEIQLDSNSVRNLLLMLKQSSDVLRTWKPKESMRFFLNVCYFLVLATHLCWKWWQRRKGKDRATHSSVFPYSSVSQRKKVLVECAYIKKWNKSIYLVLCNVSSVLITKYVCMYELRKMNCVISMRLHLNLHLS